MHACFPHDNALSTNLTHKHTNTQPRTQNIDKIDEKDFCIAGSDLLVAFQHYLHLIRYTNNKNVSHEQKLFSSVNSIIMLHNIMFCWRVYDTQCYFLYEHIAEEYIIKCIDSP